MRLLICGNAEHLIGSWLETAFPKCRLSVIAPAGTVLPSKDAQLIPVDGTPDRVMFKSLFDACDYDYALYFSNALTPGQNSTNDADTLSAMVQALNQNAPTRIIYLRPAKYLIPTQEAESFQAAKSALFGKLSADRCVILGCPFLYHAQGSDPFFKPMFQALNKTERDSLNFPSNAPAAFLEVRELGKLLHQFCFDRFPAGAGEIELPAAKELTMQTLADTASAFYKGWTVQLHRDSPSVGDQNANDGGWLNQNYGWTPKRDIVSDLPTMFDRYRKQVRQKRSFREAFLSGFQNKPKPLTMLLELGLTALLGEVCITLSANMVQFSIIDYRLLFVVIISSVYGLRMGLFAALVASIALFQAYLAQGYDAMILFYEPTNWTGFIAYFLCGVACGFAKWSSKEQMKMILSENKLLSDKYVFLKRLYEEGKEDRDTYKEQILNSRDSYGKVLLACRTLTANTIAPLCTQMVQALENLLDNRTVGVYTVGSTGEAHLAAQSAGYSAPQTIDAEQMKPMLPAISKEGVFMNTDAVEGCPACAIGISIGGRLKLLLTVEQVPFARMTLSFYNQLKAVAEQMAVSLGHAVEYEKLLKKVS